MEIVHKANFIWTCLDGFGRVGPSWTCLDVTFGHTLSHDYNRIQVCFQLFMQVVEGVALKMENSGLHLLNSKLHADARVARIGREALDLVAEPFSA